VPGRRVRLILVVVLAAAGIARTACPAESKAACPVQAITGAGPDRAPRPDAAQLEAVVKALTADINDFASALIHDLAEAFREGAPEVEPADVEACVEAIVAQPAARGALLTGMRDGVNAWARDRAESARLARAEDPAVPALRSVSDGCIALGRNVSGEAIADLYWTLAYEIIDEKPANGETIAGGRPAGSRLWPVALFRDALVEAYANQSDLAAALAAPPAPPAVRSGERVQIPPPADTPAYRDYLTWLEPNPGGGLDARTNPLLGAALTCLDYGSALTTMNHVRSF
jgi:hypothetical protein